MKNILFILLMNVITFTFTTGCATYPYSGSVEMRDENVWFKAAFNDEDRRLIHDYYRAQYKTLPPGLAKKDTAAWSGKKTSPVGTREETLIVTERICTT
jgi:hypothetical protein